MTGPVVGPVGAAGPRYAGVPPAGVPVYIGVPAAGVPSYIGEPPAGVPSYIGVPFAGVPVYIGVPPAGVPVYIGVPPAGVPLSYSGLPAVGLPGVTGRLDGVLPTVGTPDVAEPAKPVPRSSGPAAAGAGFGVGVGAGGSAGAGAGLWGAALRGANQSLVSFAFGVSSACGGSGAATGSGSGSAAGAGSGAGSGGGAGVSLLTVVRTTTGGIGREPGMLIRIRVVSVVSVLGSSGSAGAAELSSGPSCEGWSDGYWRDPYGGVPEGYAAPPRPWAPEDELSVSRPVSRLKAGSPGWLHRPLLLMLV